MAIQTFRNTSTWKIHRGYDLNSPLCNTSGSVRIPTPGVPVTPEQVAECDASRFCKKCFPKGKPQA